MNGPKHGPNYAWTLPADWPEVRGLSEIALRYLKDFINADEVDHVHVIEARHKFPYQYAERSEWRRN